jgi:hypothetical protein
VVSFSVDSAAIEQTLDKMAKQLTDFPTEMGEELTNWQREDMHRHFPNTEVGVNEASTMIWPRSRKPRVVEKTRHSKLPARRPQGAARAIPTGHRPVLRDSLYKQLVERMDKLMEDKLSWA